MTNDEIGAELEVTESTVKAHVSSLLRKFDVANRAELAVRVVALGIVDATKSSAPVEERL